MKNKEEQETINLFQWFLWAEASLMLVIGAYLSVTTGSWWAHSVTAFAIAQFWNSIDDLPTKPVTYGVVTCFGRRTSLYVKGKYFLPKILFLDLIKVEILVEDTDSGISVTTFERIRADGKISISFLPNTVRFGDFLDVGGYEGVAQQLKGIGELAVQKAVEMSQMPLQEIETQLSVLSDTTYKILTGKIDVENPHNDVAELGIIVKKVQVTIVPPDDVAKARQTQRVIEETMRGVKEQAKGTLEIARKLQQDETSVPCGPNDSVQEKYYRRATEMVQLALKQISQTTVKGGRPVVVTDGKGSK